jgi:hypothetical protein
MQTNGNFVLLSGDSRSGYRFYSCSSGACRGATEQLENETYKKTKQNDSQRTKLECSSQARDRPFVSIHLLFPYCKVKKHYSNIFMLLN